MVEQNCQKLVEINECSRCLLKKILVKFKGQKKFKN